MIELDPNSGRILLREHDPNECLILYGSHARGDFTAASDVDVLRVANARAVRESIDESITLHTYTLDDLLLMARQGSLFVLHLLQEGRALNDPNRFMTTLQAAFCKPDSYLQAARARLGCAIRLLDIDDSLFGTAPREFVATASFMCRSLLYATHADRGAFSFSLRVLALRDDTASLLLALKQSGPKYEGFLRARQAARAYFQEHLDQTVVSTLPDLAALGHADAVFEGLMRRIKTRVGSDPYDDTASSMPRREPSATGWASMAW
jgi:hypothetical protein